MRFRFPLLALLPIVGGLFAQPANPTSEAQSFIESHFRAARTAESAQQYDKASQEYEVILNRYPLVVNAREPAHMENR
jgi:hypothetical protein